MPLFNTRKNVINSQVPSRDVKYHSVSYSTDPKGTSSATLSNIEIPGGAVVSNGNTYTLPSNTVSFTVTAQTGTFDISFDGGATYAMAGRKGSRTWGQGTIETIDVSQVVILSNGDIDIIWETL